MTVYELLKEVDLPVSYYRFKSAPTIPFLVYRGAGATTLLADRKVYHSTNRYEVDLYFEQKNSDLENKMENLFSKHCIKWQKGEDVFIESENLYRITYYI